MRIDFKCSGGFANLNLNYLAETDDIPTELAQELQGLVTQANFFDIEANQAIRGFSPPDVFSYQIYLSDGGKQKVLNCNDVTAPKSLRPLLKRLRKLAIEQRKAGK